MAVYAVSGVFFESQCSSKRTSVGGEPHLLKSKLLDAGLIGGDGGALDTDRVLKDGRSGVLSDLVVGLVTVLKSLRRLESCRDLKGDNRETYKIVVLEVDIKVGVDELRARCKLHVSAETLHINQPSA